MVEGTNDTGFEGKDNGKDDCDNFGFSNRVDNNESSPRFLGPLTVLVGGGTMGESEEGHWKAAPKLDVMSTRSSFNPIDTSSMFNRSFTVASPQIPELF